MAQKSHIIVIETLNNILDHIWSILMSTTVLSNVLATSHT